MNNILLEKQGVPDNFIKLSDYIATDVCDILNIISPATIDKKYKSDEYKLNFYGENEIYYRCQLKSFKLNNITVNEYSFDEYMPNEYLAKYDIDFEASFTLDSVNFDTINYPISKNSKINLKWNYIDNPNILRGNNYESYINSEQNFDVKTIIKKSDNILFEMNININHFNPYLIDHKKNEFKNILRKIIIHELTHVINRNLKNDNIFNTNYNKIKNLIKDNSISSKIAYLFYVTSIPDERNAYVAQFYSEYKNCDNYKETSLYKNLNSCIDLLNNLYNNQKQHEIVIKNLFKNFKEPSEYFLKIKLKNNEDNYFIWFDHFYETLVKNFNKTLKKMEKTTTLDESYLRKRNYNYRY